MSKELYLWSWSRFHHNQRGLCTYTPGVCPSTSIHGKLQGNEISNISRSDFSKLYHLVSLNLSSNHPLTHLSACTFTSQELSEHLDISKSGIAVLDEGTFSPLRSLTYLDLSRNNVKLKPNMFFTLRKLRYLNLYENGISRVENDTFQGLHSLEFLSLQRNKLSYTAGTFEPHSFRGLNSLQTPHIQGNQPETCGPSVIYPDAAMSSLVSLRNLSLDGCPSTPGSGFRSLRKLSFVDFSTNFHTDLESFCNMGKDIPSDFFLNFDTKHPLTLNMSNCNLQKIPPMLFKPVSNTIYALSIAYNRGLTLEGFRIGSEGFANSSLSFLDITHLQKFAEANTEITNITFQHLKHTALKQLVVQFNYIAYIHPVAILDLPSTLEYLSLSRNRIQFSSFLLSMPALYNLKIFDGNSQLIYTESVHRSRQRTLSTFYRLDSDKMGHQNGKVEKINSKSYRPGVKNDSLAQGIGSMASESPGEDVKRHLNKEVDGGRQRDVVTQGNKEAIIPLPKRLEVIYLNNLKLGCSIPSGRIVNNAVLRHLEYSNNLAQCWEGPVKNVPYLQYLDLSRNSCNRMNLNFFKYATNLTTLILWGNLLGETLASDRKGIAFSTLGRLVSLDLSRNAIKDLSETAFIYNIQLEILNLSHNQFHCFQPRLQNLTSLRKLDLSNNMLTGLSERTCHELYFLHQNNNFTVNLQKNILTCDCSFVVFLRLLIDCPSIFEDVKQLNFTLLNGTVLEYRDMVTYFQDMEHTCGAETLFIVVLILFSLLCGVISVVAVYHHNRWKLTYLLLIARKQMLIGATVLQYRHVGDVFITYDQDELRWRLFMQSTFLPGLEQIGITRVLGELDFDGGPWQPQVAGAIVATKKTLVLLSRELFEDSDREAEFNLAITHELHNGRQVVVPIFLEDVDVTTYPPEIAAYLLDQSHRCLKYRNTERFWYRLKEALSTGN